MDPARCLASTKPTRFFEPVKVAAAAIVSEGLSSVSASASSSVVYNCCLTKWSAQRRSAG